MILRGAARILIKSRGCQQEADDAALFVFDLPSQNRQVFIVKKIQEITKNMKNGNLPPISSQICFSRKSRRQKNACRENRNGKNQRIA